MTGAATFDIADIPPMVLLNLCGECRHGKSCNHFVKGKTPAGGVTCLGYQPKPSGKALKREHVLALPDREPCAECACRKGTEANSTHHTIADFEDSIANLTPFLCHGEGRDRICAGWLRAAKARAVKGE